MAEIVVVDGYTVNPGDNPWEPLEKRGRLQVHDRASPESLPDIARTADILITNKCPISAEAIAPGDLPYRRDDNFSATIAYEDGSLAHLLYTSLGPKTGLGKERIEIFCDGETYVVDDFRKLTTGSDGAVMWQSGDVDKGHFEELSRFGDALAAGDPSPIAFDDLVETSAVALHVQDLLFGHARGGQG